MLAGVLGGTGDAGLLGKADSPKEVSSNARSSGFATSANAYEIRKCIKNLKMVDRKDCEIRSWDQF